MTRNRLTDDELMRIICTCVDECVAAHEGIDVAMYARADFLTVIARKVRPDRTLSRGFGVSLVYVERHTLGPHFALSKIIEANVSLLDMIGSRSGDHRNGMPRSSNAYSGAT